MEIDKVDGDRNSVMMRSTTMRSKTPRLTNIEVDEDDQDRLKKESLVGPGAGGVAHEAVKTERGGNVRDWLVTVPSRKTELVGMANYEPEKATVQEIETEWSCCACTFLNDVCLRACSMCETPAPAIVLTARKGKRPRGRPPKAESSYSGNVQQEHAAAQKVGEEMVRGDGDSDEFAEDMMSDEEMLVEEGEKLKKFKRLRTKATKDRASHHVSSVDENLMESDTAPKLQKASRPPNKSTMTKAKNGLTSWLKTR